MGENNKVISSLVIFAVVLSLVAAGFTYFSITRLATVMSGYASMTAVANLSVESSAAVNFTVDTITWGSGRVGFGSSSASLTTYESNNVTGGNWTLSRAGGLRMENIGNVNVTLNLSVGKSAASFIGGTNPAYEWNISEVEANSCVNSTGFKAVTSNAHRSTSTASQTICSPFVFVTGTDTIRIDLNLTIPEDSTKGLLTDTITATVTT